MESFVSDLAQEVRCTLCKDRFIESKLLRCFHAFCKACIKRHAQLQLDGEGNIFKCPECSSETSLPELSDVDDLNPSPLHTRILMVLEFVESDKVCSISKSHSTASWYCFECSRSLCDECQMNHSLFTKDNHKVVSLSNLKKEDLEFMLAKEDNCYRHSDCKLDFFCQSCDILICFECLKLDHADHKTILNEKHATTVKDSLDDQLKKLSLQEQQMSSDVKVLEYFAVNTKEKGEMAIKEIQAKAKEIIEKVQESERELIKQIQEQIDNSEKEKRKGWNVLNKTERTKRFLNQAIEKRLPTSHMKNVQDLVCPMTDDVVPSVQENSEVVFVPSEECIGLLKVGLGKLTREESYSYANKDDNGGVEDDFTLIDGIVCKKKERYSRIRQQKIERKRKKKRERETKRENQKTENEEKTKQVERSPTEFLEQLLFPWQRATTWCEPN